MVLNYPYRFMRFGLDLVLPEPNNRPTLIFQIPLDSFISAPISLNLSSPKFVFHLVFPPGELPSVPEVPVQENTNHFFLKNDVGGSKDGFDVGFEFAGSGFFE